jgi:predicted membrane protein
MVRLLIVLFWISLIVGTYVTGNVLGNWVVCLLALFFFIRSRRRRDRYDTPAETASRRRWR